MDKIVFVGEALVGNQAVSQLEKFNEGLRNFSTNKRQIDAVILSKVRTWLMFSLILWMIKLVRLLV